MSPLSAIFQQMKQAEELHAQLPDGVQADKVLRNLNILSLRAAQLAKTEAELVRVLRESPYGGVAEKLARRKLDRLWIIKELNLQVF